MNMKIRSDMKQFFVRGAALLCALAAIACQNKELDVDVVEPVEEADSKTLTVIATQADTRTTISYDNGSYKSLWQTGDQIIVLQAVYGLFPDNGYLAFRESNGLTLSESDARAEFSFVAFDPLEGNLPSGESIRYMGFSPANLIGEGGMVGNASNAISPELWESWWGVDYTTEHMMISCVIPTTQKPTAGSFDPASDLLVSRMVEESSQPESLALPFARLGSIAKITLKGLDAYKDYYVVDGRFTCGSSWQGSGFLLYDSQLERTLPASALGVNSDSNVLIFSPEGVQVDDKGEAVIWLRTLSGELTDWFSLEILLNDTPEIPKSATCPAFTKYVNLAERNKSIVFEEGDITAFSVAMERQSFAISFDDWTMSNYPGLANKQLEIPYYLPQDYVEPKKAFGTKGGSSKSVELGFSANEPWTVAFSQSWLSSDHTSGDGSFDYLQLFAELNNTGEPRTATMTFTGTITGTKYEIMVIQVPYIAPRSITASIESSTVAPFQHFGLEVTLDTDDQSNYDYVDLRYETTDEDVLVQRTDEGFVAFTPGSFVVYACFSDEDTGTYMESDRIMVTATQQPAPTDWYFLIRRNNKPCLVHRSATSGTSDDVVVLFDDELAEANEMAFDANGNIYIVGAIPNEGELNPCLWVYNGSSVESTVKWMSGHTATDIAFDTQTGDYYVVINSVEGANSVWSGLFKNKLDSYFYEFGKYRVMDVTIENGRYYAVGTNVVSYNPSGNTPYYWAGGNLTQLKKLNLGNNLDHAMYCPEAIAVQDTFPYIVGYVGLEYGSSYFRRALHWEGNFTPFYRSDYLGGGYYYMLHDVAKSYNHFIMAGEKYQNHNTYNSGWAPYLFYDFLEFPIPLNYSQYAGAGLDGICVYNGSIPALSGTVVDGSTPHRAFWSAPYATPFLWDNDADTIVDFLVK